MKATIYCRQLAKKVIDECQDIDYLNDYPWIESAAIHHGQKMWDAIEKCEIIFTKTQRKQIERRSKRGVDDETIQLFFLAGIVQDYIDQKLQGGNNNE